MIFFTISVCCAINDLLYTLSLYQDIIDQEETYSLHNILYLLYWHEKNVFKIDLSYGAQIRNACYLGLEKLFQIGFPVCAFMG